jgi:hypothetical protein
MTIGVSKQTLYKFLKARKWIVTDAGEQYRACHSWRHSEPYHADRYRRDIPGPGMSFWPSSHGLSIFREVLRIDQDYYPETLGEHFIINAPFIFTGIWALVKGWLDPVTAAKFHILGSDYQQVLRERIKPEHL